MRILAICLFVGGVVQGYSITDSDEECQNICQTIGRVEKYIGFNASLATCEQSCQKIEETIQEMPGCREGRREKNSGEEGMMEW